MVDPAKVLGDDMGRSEWGYYRAGLIQGYGRALRELEKRDDGEEETHPSTGETVNPSGVPRGIHRVEKENAQRGAQRV